MTRPARACDEIRRRPAPAWGFAVVVSLNLAISATTLTALALLGREPFLPSWLTFLPDPRYYLVEIAFLPPLRVAMWLLAAAALHLVVRLGGHASDLDLLLNLGGLVYLVVMPSTFAVDWTAIALDAYVLPVVAVLHGVVVLVWSAALTVIGLRRLLGVPLRRAVLATVVAELVTVPFLALLAR